MSYIQEIVKGITALRNKAKAPPLKHKVEEAVAEAYFWDTVQSIAKGHSEKAWAKLGKDINYDLERDPGEHVLLDVKSFTVELKVSEKVRRFNAQSLAEAMAKSKFKVPIPVMLQAVEQAKVPSKSTNTYKIVEKGV